LAAERALLTRTLFLFEVMHLNMRKTQENQENSWGIAGRPWEKAICVVIAIIKDSNPWTLNPKPGWVSFMVL
jgi:hypothetical protein